MNTPDCGTEIFPLYRKLTMCWTVGLLYANFIIIFPIFPVDRTFWRACKVKMWDGRVTVNFKQNLETLFNAYYFCKVHVYYLTSLKWPLPAANISECAFTVEPSTATRVTSVKRDWLRRSLVPSNTSVDQPAAVPSIATDNEKQIRLKSARDYEKTCWRWEGNWKKNENTSR